MPRTALHEIALDVPALRALFVATLPEGRLFEAWMRPKEPWNATEAATHIGDIHRACCHALEGLGVRQRDAQLTIESGALRIVIREVRDEYVVAFTFDRTAAASVVAAQVKRMLQRLDDMLPAGLRQEQPRGARLVDFVLRYAPDAHAVLQRVSLKTGIAVTRLQAREAMTPEELERLEAAVKDVLGLESLDV